MITLEHQWPIDLRQGRDVEHVLKIAIDGLA